MKKVGIIILAIALLCVVGIGGYYLGKTSNEKEIIADTTNTENIDNNNTVIDNTTQVEINDINENQNLKFYYYASKQQEDTDNARRFSITLSESSNKSGFFSLSMLNEFEGPVAHGYYKIENSKLILSIGPFAGDNKFNEEEAIFKYMKATLIDDTEQQNYKSYTLNYNQDELQIGSYKLYTIK